MRNNVIYANLHMNIIAPILPHLATFQIANAPNLKTLIIQQIAFV